MHRSASIALLVAFALAGCGSDSGTSKQDFVRKADSICAEAEKQTQAIGSDTPLPDVIDQTRAIVSRSLADLRALDRPSEDGEQLDIFLGLLDQELALFPGFERAATEGDDAELATLESKASTLERKTRTIARAYGLHNCAR